MSRVHPPPPVTRAPDRGFRLRDIALAAYGPTVVSAIGHGAVMPMLALRARELGADVSTAALVVALLGIGMLMRRCPPVPSSPGSGSGGCSLAGLLDAVVMAVAALSQSVLVLGAPSS